MPENRSKAYTDAGVNITAADALISRIRTIVSKTHTTGVLSDIGSFGGVFKPDLTGLESPVLVASADGVGTKLKLAFQFNLHNTVGIDLVAMSVNDILVQGAVPLFFLDYFATGELDPDVAARVIEGIGEGCRRAGCALLGGETAEMPGMYAPGEYDLAGFCVGLADNARLVDGSGISVGDVVIGLASSGVHSNGYSLVRKLLKKSGLSGDDMLPGDTRTVRDVLLEPTIIYADAVRNLMRDFPIKGMVHVTGGGFYGNIPRVLPAPVGCSVHFGSWEIPPVFRWLKKEGGLSWPEMLQIFNCGIGYMLIVSPEDQDEIMQRLHNALQVKAWMIGSIKLKGVNAESVEIMGIRQVKRREN